MSALVGAAIGGIVSGIGSFLGSKKEADALKDARKALAALKPEAARIRKNVDPWGQFRSDYAYRLNSLLTGDGDFKTDPGYRFRVEEDARATERAASARGMNISGNVLAELGQRRQDIASQEYGNIINRLIGLSAATPEQAQAAGQIEANMLTTGVTGQAQALIGQGAAEGRGIASLGSSIGGAISSISGGGGFSNFSPNIGSFGGADINLENTMSGNTGATAAGFNVGSSRSALSGANIYSDFTGATSSTGSIF